MPSRTRTFLARAVALAAWLGAVGICPAADSLVWRAAQDRVDADIRGWELPRLLEHLTEATGWEIFVEPGAKLARPATVRFQKLTTGAALERLLGGLNYGLVPQRTGPDKLLVFRTSKEGATERVRPRARPGTEKRIPNELVAMLRPEGDEDIGKLAARLGAKVTGRSDKLGAYRLEFADEAAADAARRDLLGNDDVRVDYNYPVQHPADPNAPAPSGVVAPALALKPGAGPDSSRLVIALVDTPVQSLPAPFRDFMLPSISVAGPATQGGTMPTHATSMAESAVFGLDRSTDAATTPVRFLPVDVYGNSATTTTYEVALGVKEAVENGASIVNLPLGSPGDSQLLHNVIKQGYNRDVLFVAAAGNQPTTAPTYPAAYPEVIAVTARDRTGAIASYANRGSFVDVAAPDTQVVNYGGRNFVVSGTSVSTSYFSGFTAGIATKSGQTPTQAVKSLAPVFSPTARRGP
jgi:hypothetical protein